MKSDYYVYAMVSIADGRIYVGISSNIKVRLKYHNSGNVFSTKGYRPWKLFYQEFVGNRIDARKREKYLKSGYGKEFLKSIIANL
ncbi:GIY-YIG nuclease family protein [bacterium]|nr:GIY-YIG nuclease family protein [bacterium]